MFTEGCDRCVADRRARRLRALMTISACLCIALCAIPCASCCLLSGVMDGGHPPWEGEVLRVGEAAPVLVALAVLLVVAVVVLGHVADRFIRQASALSPRPPPDPLASYRDGNGVRECPAHPFAPPE